MIMDQIRDRKPVRQRIFHLWFCHSSSADLCLSPGSFLQLELEVACGFEAITPCYLIPDLDKHSGCFENFFSFVLPSIPLMIMALNHSPCSGRKEPSVRKTSVEGSGHSLSTSLYLLRDHTTSVHAHFQR